MSFSRTDSGLCIYHLIAWSNFTFLQNSLWITLPTESCLFLFSFSAYLMHLLIMWLTVSSLWPHHYYYYYYYFPFYLDFDLLFLREILVTTPHILSKITHLTLYRHIKKYIYKYIYIYILGRTKMASGGRDARRHKFWLSVKFLQGYVQKIYRLQYYLSTLLRPLTPFTEERWSKFYSPTGYRKKPSQLKWCSIETPK